MIQINSTMPCEFVRAPFFSDTITLNTTLDNCITSCLYDSNCMGLIHSNETCIYSSGLEFTDNSDYGSEQVVYSKIKKLPYYSQYCVRYPNRKQCNKDIKCSWNKGRIPYNNYNFRKSGYCGRVKCYK